MSNSLEVRTPKEVIFTKSYYDERTNKYICIVKTKDGNAYEIDNKDFLVRERKNGGKE